MKENSDTKEAEGARFFNNASAGENYLSKGGVIETGMKKVFILAAIALVAAITLSGCMQPPQDTTEQFVIQGEQYLMPQSQANAVSDFLKETYDTILPEEMEGGVDRVKYLECYKRTHDPYCGQTEEQKRKAEEDDQACRMEKSAEECGRVQEVMRLWADFILDMSVRTYAEKDKKMPIILNIKKTRSMYELAEIHSSLMKIGWDMVGAAIGIGSIVLYPDFLDDNKPFMPEGTAGKKLTTKTEIKDYFIGIRDKFEKNKGWAPSNEDYIKWLFGANVVNTADNSGVILPDKLQGKIAADEILSLPSPQKEKIIEKYRAGIEELKEICIEEANKFDTAMADEDDWQMIYSGSYLTMCNRIFATPVGQ